MTHEKSAEIKHRIYQTIVTAAGISLWLAALVVLTLNYTLRDQLIFLVLVPMIAVVSSFSNIFPLPSSLKFAQEKVTFTPTDSIILLVACWHGIAPAIFIAGLDGLIASRRAVRRLSSNTFSFGMLSLVAAASASTINALLLYGFSEIAQARQHSFPAVAVALLVANLVHILVNTGLVSVFFALRQRDAVLRQWRRNFLWAAPNFLLTSAMASVLYITLQYNALLTFAIGAPIIAGLCLGHRQYRNSVQERLDAIERAQQERVEMMDKAHRETIEALAVAINAKDEVTHGHVLRVQVYAAGVARLLGCTEAEVEALRAGALLHDIGKIAVPDYILNKPGKLTAEEFEKMKVHTLVGAQILGRVDFPYPIVPVVRHHHERWDGRGYPDALRGEDIPLTARILSVVDCFDAVREDRQYRKGMTREEAIKLLMDGVGTQYDPRVVGTFVTHLPEFEAEILAMRNTPPPDFGIGPVELLSEAARAVAPAAGLAEAVATAQVPEPTLTNGARAALDRLGRELDAGHTPAELARAFTRGLKAVVPYDSCVLTLLAAHGGEEGAAHAEGMHAGALAERRVVPGEGVTGWALANRQPFYNADPELDLPPALAARCADFRTLAACPVLDAGELHGVVTLYSATLEEYGAQHRRMLEESVRLLASSLTSRSHSGAAAAGRSSQTMGEDLRGATTLSAPAAGLGNVVLKSDLMH
ncbi:MAG TPA: HD domain-containing phosphohydrolase [Pyrinomonadaceae bacterium]|jgi:putative nucleotidyltransferase with HDIG domain